MTRPRVDSTDRNCEVCARVWPSHDHAIADFGLSAAYLFEDQCFPGRTVLVLRRHATELFELSREERSTLMEDITAVAQALATAFKPVKINYELLGNQLPHMHWHIIPRLADDPAPLQPVWTFQGEAKRLGQAELENRIALIRQHLPGAIK